MSIFKESFRSYVKKQLELRQAIISLGNDGGSRYGTPQLTFSEAAGGEKITIPYGAFYANTLNRTCVVRMSSGVDLTYEGRYNVLEPWEISQGLKEGSDLAKLYILEGGALDTGNNKERAKPDMDWLTNAKPKSGWTNAVNQKNSTYGDALSRSNTSKLHGDDYGIVPMPGIVDVQVKTKSAYGSIREAKINFKCHNQRQLAILELLYMRPGIPILLEWGWTAYVNNQGKLITNNTLPNIPDFWKAPPNNSMSTITRKIIDNKEKTGGNYDGLMGMVKNFAFKARKDGGYDCSTELTAMGEMIESLKGRPAPTEFSEDVFQSLYGGDLKDLDKEYGGPTYKDDHVRRGVSTDLMNLAKNYQVLKPEEGDLDTLQLILIDLQGYLLMNDEIYGYTSKKYKKKGKVISTENLKALYDYHHGRTRSSKYNNVIIKRDYLKSFQAAIGRAFTYFDLELSSEEDIAETQTNYFTNFINHMGARHKLSKYDHEDIINKLSFKEFKRQAEYQGAAYSTDKVKSSGWRTGFIKWEAFAYLLNKYAITPLQTKKQQGDNYDEQAENEPILKIATKYIEHEDKNPGGTLGYVEGNQARIRPYQYADVPMKNWLCGTDKSGKPENWSYYKAWTGDKTEIYKTPAQVCDRSFDHGVCILPHGCSNFGGMKLNDPQIHYPKFDLMYLSSVDDPKREKVKEFIEKSEVKKEEQLRSIGNIMFNMDYLITKYQEMAYDEEDETYIRKDDFSIYKYIEEIWSGVNKACGGAHKFLPQVDHEKPDIVRIIDMQLSKTDIPDPKQIHTLNIQGNSTIVRDFTYNSLVPSALSATIGIAMQNPDSISDLDGATFAAMAKNIKSRFIETKGDTKEAPTEEEKLKWRQKYDKKIKDVKKLTKKLVAIGSLKRMGYGQHEDEDLQLTDDRGFGDNVPPETPSGPNKQKRLYKSILGVMGRHSWSGKYEDGPLKGQKYYKGQTIPVSKSPNASSVIPLKFNAKMDGIGGIVIGNIFQIDPSRLPRGYKGSDVAFVTTGESQKITAGGDWTTTINGQLTLLPNATVVSDAEVVKEGGGGDDSTTTPSESITEPAKGITKLSELKDTSTEAGGTGPLQPIKDLLSDLEGTEGANPYGVYNYGTSSKGVHPCSSVTGDRANKDAMGRAPINTLTIKEVMRRQALPGRIPQKIYDRVQGKMVENPCNGESVMVSYDDGKNINGCEIFAAGKWQIIPKTMKSAVKKGIVSEDDIFDAKTQEILGDYFLLTKRRRLAAYLEGTNAGSKQDLIHAINECGWEWASVPIINFAAEKYAKKCGETMSSVMGNVHTGGGNHGNYCDDVNKSTKKTFVKNIIINLIHSRFQQAKVAKIPTFQPDFIEFDIMATDKLSGSKQVGKD